MYIGAGLCISTARSANDVHAANVNRLQWLVEIVHVHYLHFFQDRPTINNAADHHVLRNTRLFVVAVQEQVIDQVHEEVG